VCEHRYVLVHQLRCIPTGRQEVNGGTAGRPAILLRSHTPSAVIFATLAAFEAMPEFKLTEDAAPYIATTSVWDATQPLRVQQALQDAYKGAKQGDYSDTLGEYQWLEMWLPNGQKHSMKTADFVSLMTRHALTSAALDLLIAMRTDDMRTSDSCASAPYALTATLMELSETSDTLKASQVIWPRNFFSASVTRVATLIKARGVRNRNV
jgi:hypothetical protein